MAANVSDARACVGEHVITCLLFRLSFYMCLPNVVRKMALESSNVRFMDAIIDSK